ncbi:hypothetical protein [Xanthomonas sontii]|uniref:hypothetical protein n=1 Tax=Xanthomonas sontii TaxID=2650745 RepID=UPI00123CC7FD|nr:hypothetical protein [Xanthomonas sontii]
MHVLDHLTRSVSAGESRSHQANYPNISYLNFIRFAGIKHCAMHSIQRLPPAACRHRRGAAGLPQDISPRVVDALLGGLEQAMVVLEGMAAS